MTGLGPTRRGFFCDDESISYPYRTDTVSDSVLIACFIGVPVIIAGLLKMTEQTFNPPYGDIFGQKLDDSEKKELLTATWNNVHQYKFPFRVVGSFLFGQMSCSLFMETTKLFAGRLRPNFLSVCVIDLDRVNCSQGYVEIDDSMCRNDDL
ncbi:phospholipid phosphatase 3-like [Mya arenaria]|uniref:phospholipid phosphatase 3-like n=1 Tax=Mya arenaria TaxID=6604 RepID=UPI0022E607E8|nr:phospholipid phosphatase 3-like [Mya arenaria]